MKMSEWIPCKERMPADKGKYLVTVLTESGERRVRYKMSIDRWDFNPEGEIIAWMPLPEPYEVGGA